MKNGSAPNGMMYYIGLNFIAPGIGHFAGGYWFRGLLYVLLSLAAVLAACWEAVRPLVMAIAQYIKDNPEEARIEPINMMYFIKIGVPVLIFLFIWFWSMFEIFVLIKKKTANLPPLPEEKH